MNPSITVVSDGDLGGHRLEDAEPMKVLGAHPEQRQRQVPAATAHRIAGPWRRRGAVVAGPGNLGAPDA